jgi:hypothetical protein
MQRVPHAVRRNYRIVRLYWDDAEELLKLVRENCERVTIEAEGYKVQNLDDVARVVRQQIRHLVVIGHTDNGYLHIELNRHNAWCYLSRDDDTSLRGVFTQIDDILRRRARVLQLLVSPLVNFTASTLVLLIICVGAGIDIARLVQIIQDLQAHGRAAHLYATGFGFGDLWRLPLLTAYFTYAFWYGLTFLRYHSIIYLYPWRERTTFWERHKEEIIVQVIAGVIIFVVTAVMAFAAGYVAGANH